MEHTHSHPQGSTKNIRVAFWINIVFTVIEIIGGLLTNSVAILSDAVHDLGDSVTLLFSLIMEKVSEKGGTAKLTYGYKRYSLLGAIFSSLVLILGSAFIIYNAVNRLITVEEVNAGGMVIMAVVGILFNGAAVLRLRKDSGLNAKVVFNHLLEDVLGWVSILVAGIIMFFWDVPILDPILSIAIAVFVLSRIIPMFMKVGRIFLQYKPDDIEIRNIKETLEDVEKVIEVHDVHLWSLDGTNHIFSCHVVYEDSVGLKELLGLNRRIKSILADMGIDHSTIDPEIRRTDCNSCD